MSKTPGPRAVATLLAVCLAVPALALAQGAPAPVKPAPAAPAADPAERIAEQVQAFYDRTRTFKASFKQRYTIKQYNKTKDSLGVVTFEKPGRMSWRYTNNGNRVVSDGKLIKVYDKEARQMYEQQLGKSQYPAALAFLVGGGNLKASFKWTKLDPKQMAFEGGHVLLGEPREPTPAYQKVFLYVDGATFQVRRVLLLDAQGNKNRFDFVSPEVNKKPPADEFVFVPPAGTQVVRP
jgi:outer membrane lipoprotein carrier protein